LSSLQREIFNGVGEVIVAYFENYMGFITEVSMQTAQHMSITAMQSYFEAF
jgi:hypothetical protein